MANILLLGADRERAAGLRSLLRGDGHQVTWERAVDSWRRRERELGADVVVAAVDSAEVLLRATGREASRFPAPLLVVQQEADICSDLHLDDRLVDRIAGVFATEEFLGRVDALVRVRAAVRRGVVQPAFESTGDGLRGRVSSWFRSKLPKEEKPITPYLEVASRVADWADRRDAFQPGHAERVSSFCGLVAGTVGMDDEETSVLLRAAMLHDVGKVALPVEILHEPGPLDESQLRLIRTHPARGAALLRALDPDPELARMVLYHHERPDGQGYYGKEPASVPRGAFVLAVAEAYDAMTSSRLRAPLTREDAVQHLLDERGQAYDTETVDAFAEALRPRRAMISTDGARYGY